MLYVVDRSGVWGVQGFATGLRACGLGLAPPFRGGVSSDIVFLSQRVHVP